MKVALFGGSFNPIHPGHIAMIKQILNKNLADEIWLIPSKNHPFNKTLEKEKHRIEMMKIAMKNIKKVKIRKIELKTKGISYTINTIRKLKRKYPHQFFMIIGSDILYEIQKWYKYKQLLKEIEFIVFKRKNYSFKKVPGMKTISLIKNKEKNISSTLIREKVKEGKSLKGLLSKKIVEYIKNKQLYKN